MQHSPQINRHSLSYGTSPQDGPPGLNKSSVAPFVNPQQSSVTQQQHNYLHRPEINSTPTTATKQNASSSGGFDLSTLLHLVPSRTQMPATDSRTAATGRTYTAEDFEKKVYPSNYNGQYQW
jgi:hypothetical protein